MTTKNILNAENGFKIVQKWLYNTGYRWKDNYDINKGRYRIVVGENFNIAITFKKEIYHKIHSYFVSELGGDSINVEDMRKFFQRDVKEIYIIFQNGKVYGVKTEDVVSKSIKRVNKSDKSNKETFTFPLEICTEIDTSQNIKDIKFAKSVIYRKVEIDKPKKYLNRPNNYEIRMEKLKKERDLKDVWDNDLLRIFYEKNEKLEKENKELRLKLEEYENERCMYKV